MFVLWLLRTATVKALRGKTVAGAHVHPSSIIPLEERAPKEPHPFVLVYTDYAEQQADGRDMLGAQGPATLALEMAVARRVADKRVRDVLAIAETDEGFETSLDLLHRRILSTLQTDDGPWAKIWRELVLTVGEVNFERGAAAKDGTRFAARRLTLAIEALAEPQGGAPLDPGGVFDRALTLAAADQELQKLAAMWRAEIEDDALPEWRLVQDALGLTDQGLAGIGMAPFLGHAEPEVETAPFAEVTLDPDGLTAGDEPAEWEEP